MGEDLTNVIGAVVGAIALSVLAMGWSALKKYVLQTPNKWDDAILKPIDAVVGPALRKYAASRKPKDPPDEDK